MQVSEGLRRVRGPPFPRVPPLWGRTRKAPAAPAPAGPLPLGGAAPRESRHSDRKLPPCDTQTAGRSRGGGAGEAMRGTAPCRARAAGTRTAGAEPGGAASARHGPAQGRGGGGSSSPVPARRRHRFLSPSRLPGAQRERDARAAPAPPRAANRGRAGQGAAPSAPPRPAPERPRQLLLALGAPRHSPRPSPLLQRRREDSPPSDPRSERCPRRARSVGRGAAPATAHPGDRAPAEAINSALRTRRTHGLATVLLLVFSPK